MYSNHIGFSWHSSENSATSDMGKHVLLVTSVALLSAAAIPSTAAGTISADDLCSMRQLALEFAASIMPERAEGAGELALFLARSLTAHHCPV